MIILYGILVAIQARQLVDQFHSFSTAAQLRSYSSLVSSNSNLSIHGPILEPLLIPRVSGTENNKKVQKFIISTFHDLGWSVEQDHFNDTTPHGSIAFTNIIVTKDPKAQRKIVLAAHFDSKYFKDFEFIGATDSAAPCAILINLAKSLNTLLDQRMAVGLDSLTTLQIIFFDGEEAFVEWTDTDSIYGARHLARKWEETMFTIYETNNQVKSITALNQIDALILLDLLGTKEAIIWNSQPATQWLWDRLARIHERLSVLKLLSPFMQERIKDGRYMFPPGPPRFAPDAVAVHRTSCNLSNH